MQAKLKFCAYCGTMLLGVGAVYAAQVAFVIGLGTKGSLLTDPFWWVIIGALAFLLSFPWVIDRLAPKGPTD